MKLPFKKKKETSDDPLRKEYGLLANSLYLLRSCWKYKKSMLIIMFFYAITNASMSIIWSIIMKLVIDIIQTSLATGEANPDLMPLIITVSCITVFELIMMGGNTYFSHNYYWRALYVRMKLIQERIKKALGMNYEKLEDPKMLDRMQKAMQATGGNTNGVEGMLNELNNGLCSVVKIISAMAILIGFKPWLVAVFAVAAIGQYFFFDYTRKKDKREMWDTMAPYWRKKDYMTNCTQDFSYAKDIRLFGMKGWLNKKQHEINLIHQQHWNRSRNYWIYNSIFAHGMSILEIIFYIALFVAAVYEGLSIGDITMYAGLIGTYRLTLSELMSNMAGFKQKSSEVNDFRTFIELEDDEKELRGRGKKVPRAESYVFEFKDVSFKYNGQETYALRHLSLKLGAGEKLAVVGLNGAGKTTFIKLLLRLYDVTEGEILVNGVNICEYDRNDYYSLFAPVFQDVEIFAFPLAENVSMKSPEETDKEKSKQCLIDGGFEEKLEKLPKGVNTELLKVLHDDGVDLSGGEKQKLALARALYKSAPVIILDEPTAALDALAEYKLYQDFDKLVGSRSAVYISHRLSSTRFCDNIAMFKAGEMVEYGTHKGLLEKGGAYSEMFNIQAQYYRDEAEKGGEEECVNV